MTETPIDIWNYVRQRPGMKKSTLKEMAKYDFDLADALQGIDLDRDLPLMTDISIGQRALLRLTIKEHRAMQTLAVDSGEACDQPRQDNNLVKQLKSKLCHLDYECQKLRKREEESREEVKSLSSQLRQLKNKVINISPKKDNEEDNICQMYGKRLKEKDETIKSLEATAEQLRQKYDKALAELKDHREDNMKNLERIKSYLVNESMVIHAEDLTESDTCDVSSQVSADSDKMTPNKLSKCGTNSPKDMKPNVSQRAVHSVNKPKVINKKGSSVTPTKQKPSASAVRRTSRERKPNRKLMSPPAPKRGRPPTRDGSVKPRKRRRTKCDSVDHNLVLHMSSEELELEKADAVTLSSITGQKIGDTKIHIDISAETDNDLEDGNEVDTRLFDPIESLIFKQKVVANSVVSQMATSNGYLVPNDENQRSAINTMTTRSAAAANCSTSLSIPHEKYKCQIPDCDFISLFKKSYEDHVNNHVVYHYGQDTPDEWRHFFDEFKQTLPQFRTEPMQSKAQEV